MKFYFSSFQVIITSPATSLRLTSPAGELPGWLGPLFCVLDKDFEEIKSARSKEEMSPKEALPITAPVSVQQTKLIQKPKQSQTEHNYLKIKLYRCHDL